MDHLAERIAERIAQMNDEERTQWEAAKEMWGLNDDGSPPELHPDLEPYVQESEFLGQVLKHPLVFQVPYIPQMAGMANRAYEQKKRILKEAAAEKNWSMWVFMWERPYRVDAFEDNCWQFTNREFWELLGEIWTDTENLWQNQQTWRELLTCGRRDRARHLMTPEERDFIKTVGGPDAKTITVYRGTSAPDGTGAGLSWTLNRPRAEFFARRFEHKGPGVVLTGKVPKRKIIAYFDRRSEWEIVALPEHVTIISRDPV